MINGECNLLAGLQKYSNDKAHKYNSGRRTTNKGITLFRERYNPRHTIIVGSGGIPIEEFLQVDLSRLWKV